VPAFRARRDDYLKTLIIPHAALTGHTVSCITTEMAFQPHSSFDALASVIEQLGSGGRAVRRAEAAAGDEDEALCATIDVAVPLSELGSSESGRAVPLEAVGDAEGSGLCFGLRIPGLDATAIAGVDGADVTVRGTEATLDAETVVATLEIVIRSADPDAAIDGDAGRQGRRVPAGDEGAFRRGSGRADGGTGRAAADSTGAFGAGAAGDGGATDERGGGEVSDESGDGLASVRDESVPPYEDTAYLAKLYEACDTFAEMGERIEMDVSAETVRRYMIDAGVHSPTSYELGEPSASSADREVSECETRSDGESRVTDHDETDAPSDDDGTGDDRAADGGAGDDRASGGDAREDRAAGDGGDTGTESATTDTDETERTRDRVASESLPDEHLVADGIGLPDALTLPEVVEAVVGARTVHEVERDLGLGHDRTRQLLRQLNVLDLVLCRASAASAREVSVETVAGRIRQCTPDGA